MRLLLLVNRDADAEAESEADADVETEAASVAGFLKIRVQANCLLLLSPNAWLLLVAVVVVAGT